MKLLTSLLRLIETITLTCLVSLSFGLKMGQFYLSHPPSTYRPDWIPPLPMKKIFLYEGHGRTEEDRDIEREAMIPRYPPGLALDKIYYLNHVESPDHFQPPAGWR